jgi:hypothetical protein
MAPVLTLHQGGASKAFTERPDVTMRREEAKVVRALAEEMERRVGLLPAGSAVRAQFLGWKARLTKWADANEHAPIVKGGE